MKALLPQIGLRERIRACWLGKSIGGTLGLPCEGRMERMSFSYYEPVPAIAPPNDDLELQLVWLHLVEQATETVSAEDFARAWTENIHYMWDEYGRCRWNLRRGVPPEAAGTFENPFHAGMGSPIRSEIWACLFPGDPASAAHYAAMDASLDHGEEGIAGEVFFSVMQSLVAADYGVRRAIVAALEYIPEEGETRRAIDFVRAAFADNREAWGTRAELLAKYGNENFTHAPLNVAITVWALLFGGGDFEKSILLAANAGYDTDCTAATVGATLGLAHGSEKIPPRWSEPIGEGVFIGSGILGINPPGTLDELTGRTLAACGKLAARAWTPDFWKIRPPAISLSSLGGTIEIFPSDGGAPVLWANGDLPARVKSSGGAEWNWECSPGTRRELVCVARAGAKVFVDDLPLFECPPGLPFIQAPHRCPAGSRGTIIATSDHHRIRVELGARNSGQDAAVILAYPNFHLCPWSREELPLKAILG